MVNVGWTSSYVEATATLTGGCVPTVFRARATGGDLPTALTFPIWQTTFRWC
jgi:hypothetical protein